MDAALPATAWLYVQSRDHERLGLQHIATARLSSSLELGTPPDVLVSGAMPVG